MNLCEGIFHINDTSNNVHFNAVALTCRVADPGLLPGQPSKNLIITHK
ncbi:MAG: hypothetical protein FADNKDHG_01572 [Holosporales bacterium]